MEPTVVSLYEFAAKRGDVDACATMLDSKEYGEMLRNMPLSKRWAQTVERSGPSIMTSVTVPYSEANRSGRWMVYKKPKQAKFTRFPTGARHRGNPRLTAEFRSRFRMRGFGVEHRFGHVGKGLYRVASNTFESTFVASRRELPHPPDKGCEICGDPEPWETKTKCSMRRFAWCNRIRRYPGVDTVVARGYDDDPVSNDDVRHCRGLYGVSECLSKDFLYPKVLPCYANCKWKVQVGAPPIYRQRHK